MILSIIILLRENGIVLPLTIVIGHGYGLVKNYRIILGKLNSIVKVLGKV